MKKESEEAKNNEPTFEESVQKTADVMSKVRALVEDKKVWLEKINQDEISATAIVYGVLDSGTGITSELEAKEIIGLLQDYGYVTNYVLRIDQPKALYKALAVALHMKEVYDISITEL